MRVCYLGPFDPNYPRNRIIIKGLRKNGVEVIECNSLGSNRVFDYMKLLTKLPSISCDAVLLGARGDFFGQPLVPLVKRLTNKLVVFDAVLTLTETEVLDRQLVSSGSTKASLLFLLDYVALRDADVVLCDTLTHANYYSSFFGLRIDKFERVLVSTDDDVFYPRKEVEKHKNFKVMFWGGFIPLQGVRYIVQAAKLLEVYPDITFELRGCGQTLNETLQLSKRLGCNNIRFVPEWIPYIQLPGCIAGADVCLGVFGETEKAKRVIPNKALEAFAMRKPLVTGDSPAARELLRDHENCLLVPMANPKALAGAVLELKLNYELASKIADNGYSLFCRELSPVSIGKVLKEILFASVELR
jgi:glycosyltransferase involved in cell wall biosynthesis